MAKDYHDIGSMKTKKEKDKDGNLQYYIELDKKYEGRISIDGKKLTSRFINVNRPVAKLESLLKNRIITEAEFDKKLDEFDATIDPQTKLPRGKLSFVKFDLKLEIEK